MAVGQNQWYHFGVGAPPILVYFSGDRDVHWGYGILTHGHIDPRGSKTSSAGALSRAHFGLQHPAKVSTAATWPAKLWAKFHHKDPAVQVDQFIPTANPSKLKRLSSASVLFRAYLPRLA